MGAMSPTHWLIVVGVVVLLFGAKKLPEMARSLGQSARVLKGEMRGLKEDGKPDDTASVPAPAFVPAPTVETGLFTHVGTGAERKAEQAGSAS